MDDSYSEIGTLLRLAREERKLTQEQVSHLLHIRLRYVEALEQGRLGELPGSVYTKGYLQAYALFLGLDKDEILHRFEQVKGQLSRRDFYLPQALAKEKTPASVFVWGGLAAAVAVYLIWLLVAHTPRLNVSVVDFFPEESRRQTRVSAVILKDVACLAPQDVLYPPCTAVEPRFSLLPLPRQMGSVMELAKLKPNQ